MRIRIAGAALCVAALAISASACGKDGDPSTDAGGKDPKTKDKSTAAPPSTYKVNSAAKVDSPVIKKAKSAGKITIGVKADQPGLGFQNLSTKKYTGFDIEIAKMVAADLGFSEKQITFKTIDSVNREPALKGGQVDLYVGTYTINDERKKVVSFAGPYFEAGQDLLVKKDNKDITGPDSLKGKKVCSAKGSTPLQNISQKKFGAEVSSFEKYAECVDKLVGGQIDAVTTDDSILLGFASQPQYSGQLKVVGKKFTKEPYGVGLKKEDKVLRGAVNDALEAHQKNGDWKKAFDTYLGKAGTEAPAPPALDRY